MSLLHIAAILLAGSNPRHSCMNGLNGHAPTHSLQLQPGTKKNPQQRERRSPSTIKLHQSVVLLFLDRLEENKKTTERKLSPAAHRLDEGTTEGCLCMSEGYPCSTAERQLTAEARTSGVPALGALLPVHNNKARRQGTARGSRHRDKGRLCRAEPSRAGRHSGRCRHPAGGPSPAALSRMPEPRRCRSVSLPNKEASGEKPRFAAARAPRALPPQAPGADSRLRGKGPRRKGPARASPAATGCSLWAAPPALAARLGPGPAPPPRRGHGRPNSSTSTLPGDPPPSPVPLPPPPRTAILQPPPRVRSSARRIPLRHCRLRRRHRPTDRGAAGAGSAPPWPRLRRCSRAPLPPLG